MCLQCPVTFRVYLPPTCSVDDDLMVQITLFPWLPHSVMHQLHLGSVWAAPSVWKCISCVCVRERGSSKSIFLVWQTRGTRLQWMKWHLSRQRVFFLIVSISFTVQFTSVSIKSTCSSEWSPVRRGAMKNSKWWQLRVGLDPLSDEIN